MLKNFRISYNTAFAICLVSFTLSLTSVGYAQPQPQRNVEKAELHGTRKQLATIIFSGLGGAILGLSTLSFHGRPQDNLSNIAVGFAVGIIAGTVYTTYKAATDPYEAYYSHMPEPESLPLSFTEPVDRWNSDSAKFNLSLFNMSF